MKIYGSAPMQNVYNAYAKNKIAKTQKSVQAGSPGFDINISNQGKDYQTAIEKLKQVPDVRTDKVSAIKKSIEDGTYTIDKAKLAKAIYNSMTASNIG